MAYGVCKVCGCTDNDPCYHPDHGNCWCGAVGVKAEFEIDDRFKEDKE